MHCYLYDLFQLYLMSAPGLESWLVDTDLLGTLTPDGTVKLWRLADGKMCEIDPG